MEKVSNLSKCREVVYGCSVCPDKALTNDGFRIGYSVVLTGYKLGRVTVSRLSIILGKQLVSYLNKFASEAAFESDQLEFRF